MQAGMSRGAGAVNQTIDRIGAMRFRLVALLLWALAVVTTYQFVASFVAVESTTLIAIAIVMQVVLTVCEGPFLRGMRDVVSMPAILIDTAINAAGIWIWVGNIDQSNVWRMVADVTGTSGGLNQWTAFLLAVLFGYFLAAAPEKVWR